MKNNKHTKGPWNVLVAEPCGPRCDAADYAFRIETDAGRNMPTGREAIANAHLIAAAPELLEELKRGLKLLEAIEKEKGYCTYVTQLAWHTLIKKAEGGGG